MRLKSFDVLGFRSLEAVYEIPLGQPTLLTGQNDGGKSSIIKALDYLLGGRALEEEDVTYRAGSSDPIVRVSETAVIGVFQPSSDERHFLETTADLLLPEEVVIRRATPLGEATVIEYETEVPEDEELQNIESLAVDALKALMTERGLDPKGKLKPALQAALREFGATLPQIKRFIPAPKALTALLPQMLNFSGTSDDSEDTVKRALSASLKTHLADSALQGSITELEAEASRRVESDAEDLRLWIEKRVDLRSVTISPEVRFGNPGLTTRIIIEQVPGQLVPLSHAGSGRNRRVMLAVWEWMSSLVEPTSPSPVTDETAGGADTDEQSEPQRPPIDHVIAYDEPDTHLDYSHQREFMQIVHQQVSKPHVQMVIATHSLNLIDRIDINNVVNVRLNNDHRTDLEMLRTNDHADVDSHLEAIAAALGLRTSVLLHERCFVGLEGETEQQVLPMLFRVHKQLPMQSLGIVPLECGNNDGALRFAQFLTKHNRNVVFLVDEDSRTKSAKIFSEDKLKSFGINPATQAKFLGRPNEIEDLFTDEQWSSLANEVWKRNTGIPWTPEDIAAHRDGGKFSHTLQQAFQNESDTGPGGKPEMLRTLAMRMTIPEQIPQDLRDAFDWLVERAK